MKQIFHLLPISEAQLAQQIGISAKTIRRIKQGAPRRSSFASNEKIYHFIHRKIAYMVR